MERLTTQELEAIRERIDGIWFAKAYVKGDPWKGYEVRCEATGQTIAETSAGIDAEFIANARTDIPRLLAEVERFRKVERGLRDITDRAYIANDPQLFEVIAKIKDVLYGGAVE